MEHLIPSDICAGGDDRVGQLAGFPPAGALRLSGHRYLESLTSGFFSMGLAYHAMCRSRPFLGLLLFGRPHCPLKIKIFVWQLSRDRLPFGTEVLKRHGPGDGMCPLCDVPETGSHILFSCMATRSLWSFICEDLGPDWEALDLAEFLETRANQTKRHRRLFWLVFAALAWMLWTTRNINEY